MTQGPVVVMGGYGATGQAVVRLLLQHTDREVLIAGRRMDAAEKAAQSFRREFPYGRMGSAEADAGNTEALGELLGDARLVVDCTSSPEHAATIAAAAMKAGCDYLDLHPNEEVWERLQALQQPMSAAGRRCVTQAGLHPGLPPVLVRYVLPHYISLHEVTIAGVMRLRNVSVEAMRSLLEFMQHAQSFVFERGCWRRASALRSRTIDFGPPLGQLPTYASYSPDMVEIPSRYGIERAGVYFAGFNWFVDWLVVIPLMFLKLGRSARLLGLLARLGRWGLGRFTRGAELSVLKLVARGESHHGPGTTTVKVSHPDPYVLTAAAAVGCALQILDGSIPEAGVHRMGDAVIPERLLSDLKVMGLGVDTQLPRG